MSSISELVHHVTVGLVCPPFGSPTPVCGLSALAVTCGMSAVHAQSGFAGGGLAFADGLPLLSLQVGGDVVPHAEARFTLDFFAIYFLDLGLDVLYDSGSPSSTVSWYAGGGPQVYILPVVPSDAAGGPIADPGFHLTGGADFRLSPSMSVYVELQPGTDLGFNVFLASVRPGVNFLY